ncbi:S8 family serine peptidase [Leifsonia sp. ZF2019]|uniref:S8 family peptidase n=1 Tax=Leifsonia sp. ZF2019 TaxID=2781978 RepID=UPI001CBF73F1|nr:S8 family serine peptidase [Leifsonia sp. ZF2019]UAJ80473.1 S8 family serine peptidase [Leifsonia sp. ZF2019]
MKSRGALRGMFAGALALALAIVPTVSASADTTDGNWWYDYYDVGQAHAEGWTGKGVKITVIDGQINPDLPVFSGTDLTVDKTTYCAASPTTTDANEASVHGTSVSALLIGNGTGAGAVKGIVPDASVRFEGYGTLDCAASGGKTTQFGRALQAALDAGSDIVTTSVGLGVLTRPDLDVLAEALAKGVIVVSSMPNELTDEGTLPSGANGVVGVNAIGQDGAIQSHGGVVDIQTEATVVAAGVGIATNGDEQTGSWDSSYRAIGSSMAAPLVAGMLAAAKQKYPKASSNQLIQSLIHNTTADDHELMRDEKTGYGYGPASLTHLLAVDPTKYPDTNPLLDKAYAKPTAEQIADAAHTPAPSTTGAPGESSSAPASGVPAGLFIGIGIAVLVIIAVVVIMIVVLSRRRAPNGNGGNA